MIITVHCMHLSALCPTRTTASLLLLATLCLAPVSASTQPPPRFANDTESICRPFGECEPCPHEVLREPFCQPFGNRRLLHCLPPSPASRPDSTHPDTNSPPHRPDGLSRPTSVDRPPESRVVDVNSQHSRPDGNLLQGETIAWESCGRIVVQERADFWEFIACNVLFVCLALTLVLVRSRRMSTMQARQLAARIGLGRGYG
ncbi:hypothetical protein F5148DRAFT_620154 [Russula earlei]|uniref:Uncharacterized protein n=1 Tax=Russula earlei TaxID=71964 RepID=A0ACC0UH47_9AGAM|nr:hypothetical protein F5148DRAFT_620154 [Russula earlei]